MNTEYHLNRYSLTLFGIMDLLSLQGASGAAVVLLVSSINCLRIASISANISDVCLFKPLC